jgi:hypothetical protein
MKSPTNNIALLITARTDIIAPVKSMIGRYGISIHTEYSSLNSVSVIKRAIAETGNTVFIRKAFNRLISDWGPPSLILLDYRIDLGSATVPDTDKRKLLRTFFISYIILSQKSEYPDLTGNFIILANSEDISEAKTFEHDPLKILDILGTTNEDINNMMMSFREKPGQFKKIFNLKVVQTDRIHSDLTQTLDDLLHHISGRKDQTPGRNDDEKPQAQLMKPEAAGSGTAVMVVFLFDENKAYVNNKPVNVRNDKPFEKLSLKQFHIIGNCEKKNQNEAANLIRHAVKNGLGDSAFSSDDEIVINMRNNCTIDSTTISLLVGLFTRDLADFKKKSVNVSFKNASILEKSTGYFMIKKFVHHEY